MHVIVPFGVFHPLGQPAELTVQYLILNRDSQSFAGGDCVLLEHFTVLSNQATILAYTVVPPLSGHGLSIIHSKLWK